MSTDRRESDSLLQPISSSSSTASIYSHLLTPTALLAQAGLLVFLYPIWTVLLGSELSLFSYHPLLNSLAVFFFIEGVVLLQPVKVFKKRESAKLHRTVQWIGLPISCVSLSLPLPLSIEQSVTHDLTPSIQCTSPAWNVFDHLQQTDSFRSSFRFSPRFPRHHNALSHSAPDHRWRCSHLWTAAATRRR